MALSCYVHMHITIAGIPVNVKRLFVLFNVNVCA